MSHGSVCIVQKIDFEDRILVVTVKTSGKMVLEIRLCVSVRLDVDRSVPLAGHAPWVRHHELDHSVELKLQGHVRLHRAVLSIFVTIRQPVFKVI